MTNNKLIDSDYELTPELLELEEMTAFLAQMFDGKLTQKAANGQLEYERLKYKNNNMLSSFDGICKKLLAHNDEEIIYEKIWYCNSCDVEIIINERNQRNCSICNDR